MSPERPAGAPGISRRRALRLAAGLGAGAFITGCRQGIVLEDLSQLDRLEDRELAARIAAEATSAAGPTLPPRPTATPMPVPRARDFGIESDITLTPADRFYVMKYGELQALDAADWRLEIVGGPQGTVSIGLRDLQALPSETFMRTLACISNPAGGKLIGNAVFTGAPMRAVLGLAGIEAGEGPDADSESEAGPQLKLESADGYSTGVSLALALRAESYLVYEMNGRPLLPEHGYPARCLFPGRFGQKQPKWLTRITLQDERHAGHWEAQGWSDRAPIVVSSRFDAPGNRATVERGVTIRGIAFSDDSGVAGVEILVDDRETFGADLVQAPEPWNDLVWTEWAWTWLDPAPGWHTLLARAVDGNGRKQQRPREHILGGTFPDGTSDMHSIRLLVQA